MKCSFFVPLAAVMFCLLAPEISRAQTPEPFDVHDLIAMDRISDPQLSPDGKSIVFTVSSLDDEKNRRQTNLYLARVDVGGARPLTSRPSADFSPRWSPDGTRILFLSSRSGSVQVWALRLDGGEASQVTDLPLGVSNFSLSPDGQTLAFSMEVKFDCETLECTVEAIAEQQTSRSSGVLYDRVFVRHWDTWEDGLRSHLHVMPIGGDRPVDLMKGMDSDGGSGAYVFSPDGARIVFTARHADQGEPWSTNFDLYNVATDGSGLPELLTGSNKAWDTSPAFSPDGGHLAYLAMERPGYESDRFRIMLKSWPDGQARELAVDWDRSPGTIQWSPDGDAIYAAASNLGRVSLFRVDAKTGAVETVVKGGHVRQPTVGDGQVVFGMDHFQSPVELYVLDEGMSEPRQITFLNKDRLDTTSLGEPEQIVFEGAAGDEVYAWIVKPANFDRAVDYPVAFVIHGGPQGSSATGFHYRWNPQIYAGAGYAVVLVDFHGSTGYGQDFTDAIRGDWGGKPLVDLQRGLEAALDRFDWMDGDRACALGASYGGYMVNWIAGNWSDRFDCLVNHDGVFDNRSMYFATEELWFPEWEHGGPYWENPDGHERHNPVLHVDKWQTPMLVVHSLEDHRIPLAQGLAAFNALQRKGIPSQFLYFPDENHFVSRPANSVHWHETVLGWLNRWTQ